MGPMGRFHAPLKAAEKKSYLFIAAGVHAQALGIDWGETPDPARLEALYGETGQRPDYMVPAFRW